MTDKQRPLAPVAASEIDRVGRAAFVRQMRPQVIFASTALRTRSTAAGMARTLGGRVVGAGGLYDATKNALFEYLQCLPEIEDSEPLNRVMLVGHFPGLPSLAARLTGDNSIEMEPCSLVEIALPVEKWIDIHPHCGELTARLRP